MKKTILLIFFAIFMPISCAYSNTMMSDEEILQLIRQINPNPSQEQYILQEVKKSVEVINQNPQIINQIEQIIKMQNIDLQSIMPIE